MVFSSPEFLFVFLPTLLAIYFALQRVWVGTGPRNLVLLVASLLFYSWGSGVYVSILIGGVAANYGFGRLAARGPAGGSARRLAVAGSVCLNLAVLGYFKYANFAVDQLSTWVGPQELSWVRVALPIGISFYTFQSMSYVIDVARGRVEAARDPIAFALYVASFPQLIAGPIVRYREVAEQLAQRTTRLDDFTDGALRFTLGLVKKVVIADAVAGIAHEAFAMPAESLSAANAWLGVLAFSVQIYFDFSGYSDMAIGLGRMFGFRFPENFDRPYSALSVTDFWRRWHITLSAWFRDYLYIPLGGSRGRAVRTYANLIAVFVLTGLWHGASFNFLVWGLYHGALLILERVTGQRATGEVGAVALRRAVTFLLVTLGWVWFRADDLPHATMYYQALFGLGSAVDPISLAAASANRQLLVLGFALLVAFLPADLRARDLLTGSDSVRAGVLRLLFLGLSLPLVSSLIAAESFSPFLYFRF